MEIDNIIAGKHFCNIARALIFGDENNTEWFNQNSLWTLAEEYNISGIFANGGKHIRLVTKLLDNNKFEVYDPLFTRDGNHVYIMDNDEIDLFTVTGEVFKNSDALGWFNWNYNANITEEEFDNDLGKRWMSAQYADISLLKERLGNIYSLNFPDIKKIQEDGYNCGPLAVFAALVGNRYTKAFEPHVKWIDLLEKKITIQ